MKKIRTKKIGGQGRDKVGKAAMRPLPKGVKLHSPQAKKVFNGVRFDVYQWQQKTFDGTVETYETVKRKDSVIVIPVVGDSVYIVNEAQPHIKGTWLGLVAGGAEDGEDIEEAARRELVEETGMVFKNLYLVNITQYMSGVEWFGYVFIATDPIAQKTQSLDAGERIEVKQVTFKKLIELVKAKAFRFRPRFIEEFLMQGDVEGFFDVLRNPKKYKI